MDSSHNILSNELIIAYIEGNLSEEKAEFVEEVLRSDDRAFTRFAVFYRSISELDQVDLEVTPNVLTNRVNELFDLIKDVEEPAIKTNWLDQVNIAINTIFNSQNTVATVFAVLFVMIIGINLLDQPEDFLDEQGRLRILTHLDSPDYTPVSDEEMKGITVSLDEKELIITQRLSVERIVLVLDKQNDVLFEDIISKRNNTLSLDIAEKLDSVRVILESEGMIVFDDWVIME